FVKALRATLATSAFFKQKTQRWPSAPAWQPLDPSFAPLKRSLLRRRQAGSQAAAAVGGAAQEDKAHLIRGLLADADQLRRVEWVPGVLVAIVVAGLHLELGARLDDQRLFEEVRLLPVVVPFLDAHQRPGFAFGRRDRDADRLADHVHVRQDGVERAVLVDVD